MFQKFKYPLFSLLIGITIGGGYYLNNLIMMIPKQSTINPLYATSKTESNSIKTLEKNSILRIHSTDNKNKSFGTGFVIHQDENGVYILTALHVIQEVVQPIVKNILAKVIAKGESIDMAVLYVPKLDLKPFKLQTKVCQDFKVKIIGFSSFNRSMTQKKHIEATLYEDYIELHSKEDNNFYTVRRIKANEGFHFARGNSGSPVICNSTGNVIGMVTNKEGNSIAYAINIISLRKIWRDIPASFLSN